MVAALLLALLALTVDIETGRALTPTIKRDYWPTKAWQKAAPASQGLNASALAEASRFLKTTNQKGWSKEVANGTWTTRHLDAFLVVRGGYLVHEEYIAPNARKDVPHDICSATKSVAWMALAHAAMEGKLSLDTKVTDYFPSFKPAKPSDPPYQLKQVMSMDGAINQTWANNHLGNVSAWKMSSTSPPGGSFAYTGLNSILAGAIFQKATGMKYREYIAPRIFEPIGIKPDTWRWFGTPDGNAEDGCCSFHTAENLARLGYLMLNNGSWAGKQLLDPSWVAAVPRPTRTYGACANYANFWWRKPIAGVPNDAYWAWGGGGEFIVVIPSLDLVVVLLFAGQLSQWTPPASFPAWAGGQQFFPKVSPVIVQPESHMPPSCSTERLR